MKEQNYSSHRQYVPAYHYYLAALLLVLLVASVIELVGSIRSGEGVFVAVLIVGIVIALVLMTALLRTFPLRAQDRIIRMEENFRHYVMTGQPLGARITVRQSVGLRFASDEEFVELVRRAAESGMSEDDIKQAITTWRADTYRV